MDAYRRHAPVLRQEAVSMLCPKSGETVLDVTLGLGGHAEAFLEATAPDGMLIGLDADSENLRVAQEALRSFGDRVRLHHANFREIGSMSLPPIDMLFADLGLSSPHVDDPERGFSFRAEGPLDLRFDRSRGLPAAEKIRASKEEELRCVFLEYGELPQSKKLASVLYRTAREHDASTTASVRSVAELIYGWKAPQMLPQVFQALRMWVNDELGALRLLLETGPRLLRSGGRMGIISYHSLEDRLVKTICRSLATGVKDPVTGSEAPAAFRILTPKPIRPSERELGENPRSRSALLRAVQKLHEPESKRITKPQSLLGLLSV